MVARTKTRTRIHDLVDEVPDEKLPELERYVSFLRSGADDPLTWVLESAPEDDEPVTPEEEQSLQEAREAYRAGRTTSLDDVERLADAAPMAH
ncbi:MAG TPA: hypothetical protein VGR16_07445 [Thermomicrobiales bacterium]|nr:hypothetical protein [Thermomicrobiales bacterium]